MDNAKQTISFYWSHLKRFKKDAIGTALLFPIVILVDNYIPPLVLAAILNKLAKHQYVAHHVWQSFGSLIITYSIISLTAGVVAWRIFDIFYWRLEGQVERSIGQSVFKHLISQSTNFHANEFSGTLVSRTNKILSAYIRLADTTLFSVAPLILGVVYVTAIMAHRAPIYVAILVSGSLIYIASSFSVTKKVRMFGSKAAASESEQTGVLADAVTNVVAIKSFAQDEHEISRFNKATDKTFGWLRQMYRSFQIQQLFFSSVTGALTIGSLIAAIISVVSFNANLATAFLIFNYTASIISQLFIFSNQALRNYSRAFGDASEMVEIMSLEPEVKDPINPEKLLSSGGKIEFKNVTFSHNGSSSAIFEDFSLDIKDGEKIGLVGHSGAGKTTFTSLLLRFSDIDSGEILIGGQNIATITQKDLHSLISYVPQEPLLFHRSIKENIAYGDPRANFEKVINASKQAHADEFIRQIPTSYDTLVGERGVKLSGGQRQRIAIARAMLRQSPVLVLDEATSALDSESEVLIQDALWKLMAGRTAIVIAHRLSTIQKMDRILVMSDGKIVEQGTHHQLLELNGSYAKLWAHQSGGFLED
jgi:ATP-binding cassette subfamily B protein